MIDQATTRLAELAQRDPALAPLARLQAETLRAISDPYWMAAVPPLDAGQLAAGEPLLHRQIIRLEPERVQRLLEQLVEQAGPPAIAIVEPLRQALRAARLDVLAVLCQSIVQDSRGLAATAASAGADRELLATLGQLATLPLLQACGARAAPLLDGARWQAGPCPVCAAWPTLAELRGLERRRWLRCGRCGSGWEFPLQRCPFCANDDFRTLGYLAPEQDREARQAVTCDRCHGYVKTVTTISAIPPAELGLHDLSSLELDLAALEREYGRPESPGFELELTLEPAARQTFWQGWRR